MEFSMQITSDEGIRKLFAELPERAQNRILRGLMQRGAAQVAVIERGEAPTQMSSGLLAMSIGASKVAT